MAEQDDTEEWAEMCGRLREQLDELEEVGRDTLQSGSDAETQARYAGAAANFKTTREQMDLFLRKHSKSWKGER